MVVIYFFLMFLAIIWIAFCLLGMMAILVGIVEYGKEFKPEGWVLGTGARLFTIAGPVLVYGISASVVVGVLYYFIHW